MYCLLHFAWFMIIASGRCFNFWILHRTIPWVHTMFSSRHVYSTKSSHQYNKWSMDWLH